MDFFVQAVNVLKILVMAVGAGLGAWGVINLMEGYGNDNPGAKSQGIKQMAGGGIVLIGLKLIPLLSNVLK
ncbi:conjugal transfer protein [Enterococcus faecalis]|nr:conjugal transfer protein [Enterococcus faecalis]